MMCRCCCAVYRLTLELQGNNISGSFPAALQLEQNIQVRLVGRECIRGIWAGILGARHLPVRCLPLKQGLDISDNRLSGALSVEIILGALTEFR